MNIEYFKIVSVRKAYHMWINSNAFKMYSYWWAFYISQYSSVGELKIRIKIWLENFEVRDHLEDLDVDRRVILHRILQKYNLSMWAASHCLKLGSSDRLF
jgi:hypothetical protein